MRVGILTLPLHTNYGGILQAYALQTVLERMGHEVDVIDAPLRLVHLSRKRRILSFSKRFFQHYIQGKKYISLDRIKTEYKKSKASRVLTDQFIKKYVHQRVLDSLNDIKSTDYDAIVVGSDQIWRTSYGNKWEEQKADDVFLGFTKGWNIKRIAYAPSFGIDHVEIQSKDIQSCIDALKLFNAVSVREESGVRICKQTFGVDAVWLPDPTLLLSREDYTKIVNDYTSGINTDSRGYLLSYILNDTPEKSAIRNMISREKGLEINITNKADNWKEGQPIIPQPPVENWLQAFENCDYVVTDSFHACVFSIIFNKQFTVIPNKGRGIDRFDSLLKMFGLEDRLVNSPSEYKNIDDIDYERVNVILRQNRERAMRFLTDSLQE